MEDKSNVSVQTDIHNFFRNILETYPEAQKHANLMGWGEDARAKGNASTDERNIQFVTSKVLPTLSCKLISVFTYQMTSILAYYGKADFLWLDNHFDNSDFLTFLNRERLLPIREDNLIIICQLITELKFNYLGHPHVIMTIADVPELSERSKIILVQDQEGMDYYNYLMDKWVAVSKLIHQPTLLEVSAKKTQFEFFIWTKFFGRVIHVTCTISNEDGFQYQGEELFAEIGDFSTPR
jgi:hypothetical protein